MVALGILLTYTEYFKVGRGSPRDIRTATGNTDAGSKSHLEYNMARNRAAGHQQSSTLYAYM